MTLKPERALLALRFTGHRDKVRFRAEISAGATRARAQTFRSGVLSGLEL